MARRNRKARPAKAPGAPEMVATPTNALPVSPAAPRLRELAVLLVILFVGVVARWVALDRLAIEHFDEGVYASDRWFGAAEGFSYPNRHLYAPPLAPLLIDEAQSLLGGSSWAPMAPSLILGSLTIPLVWWIGRRWFDPAAGLAAATLFALCEPHILYTRSAMTDAMLAFWLALAVAVASEFFRLQAKRPSDRWSLAALYGLAAGAATGLAWLTKYNGWLPLAIVAAGGAAWLIFERPRIAEMAPALFGLVLMSLVAAAAFNVICLTLPFGYAEVSKNHAQYFSGLPSWPSNLWRQATSLHRMEGWPTTLSMSLSFLTATYARGAWAEDVATTAILKIAVFFVALSIIIGATAAMGLIGLLALAFRVVRQCRREGVCNHATTWLLAAWFVGLSVAIPLYHPYPRLSMPWLVAAALAAGAGISFASGDYVLGQVWFPLRHTTRLAIGLLLIISAVVLAGPGRSFVRHPLAAWPRRDGMAKIADQLAADASFYALDEAAPGREAFGILVYGEPALFYHLRDLGVQALPVARVDVEATPNDPSLPAIYLVVGPHAQRSGGFREQFANAKQRLKLVAEYDYAPSELVWLDNYDPAGQPTAPVEKVRMYFVGETNAE